MFSINQIPLVAFLVASVSTANAATVRIPLTGLLGHQSITSLDRDSVFAAGRGVEIPRSLLPTYSKFLGLEWFGTVRAGRVVGNGLEREPIEQVLHGSFSPDISARNESIGRFGAALPTVGAFHEFWQLDRLPGGFIDRACINCEYAPDVIQVSLTLAANYIALGDSIPFVNPPGENELRYAEQGLVLLEAIEADVLSAELVFEVVPEPGTAILCQIGFAVITATGSGRAPIRRYRPRLR